MVLSEKEITILATKSRRLTVDEAIEEINKQGYNIKKRTYHNILKNISLKHRETAYDIAKNFLDDHVNVVYEMINIKKMMYKDYEEETDHFKRVTILSKITEQNTYISGYSEDTKQIIEEVRKKIGNEEKTNNISTSSS